MPRAWVGKAAGSFPMAVGAIVAVALAGLALPTLAQDEPKPERPLYFVRDVAPIFAQKGCSAAPCHGKISGQGQLKLSLMTLSPLMDHAPLEPLVSLQNPEESLLLKKPTESVTHGGGKRFRVGSKEYKTLVRWIQEGCRNPSREPLPERISVKPERVTFGPGKTTAKITVTCEFADGTAEDVTDRSVFMSKDDALVTVSPKGYLEAQKWGATAIICRYVGLTKPVFTVMPRAAEPADGPDPKLAPGNLIDSLVFANLKALGVHPSPVCDDYTFVRRVYLDLVGALPTPTEIRAFVAQTDSDKRGKLIDRLLADPRFVALRTLRLGDMLRINPRKIANGPLQQRAAMVFDTWIRDAVERNEPYNDLVHDLLTSTGSAMLSGPVNYWKVEDAPEDRAETYAQEFLGVRLACARCHNHPFDRWTTDDYWHLAAIMVKVRQRPGELFGEAILNHDNQATLVNRSVVSANKGQVAPPALLGEPPVDKDFQGDFITNLADWTVDKQNPFFARAAVNRVWSHLLGRGIVDPVDDIRETSVATVPALLEVLAGEFIKSGYDTKALVRLICNSKTYQLAADTNPTNLYDHAFFSHYEPKQMLAQVLLDALNSACGTFDRYATFPAGTTAVGLPLPVPNDFLTRFGRSDREFLATLDPHVEPTLPQTLHMINSGYINGKVAAGGGTVAKLLGGAPDDVGAVNELYLRTFCRPATPAEREKVFAYLQSAGNRKEALEDLLWSLITSREFLFIS
ncbi:MAG: DUF1549 domain-containing protein [Armatimonadetes bacterium]|nr:DUF1549 domain-containing protein [Armatimonadota bacterium]